MVIVIGTFRMPAGALARVRPAMERMLAASREEPGCIRYSYSIDVLDETIVHVAEEWQSRDALSAHFRTEHMAEWRAGFGALGITDRNLKLYECASDGEPI